MLHTIEVRQLNLKSTCTTTGSRRIWLGLQADAERRG